MPVTVVTDSTAYLPAELIAARGIRVVPLEVRLGERIGREGVDIDAAELSAALADRHLDVQTSRPAAAEFVDLLPAGAGHAGDGVVSVHLSRELSGTWESARLAADEVGSDRVRVVDSRATGMGLGYAVLAAVDAAEQGLPARGRGGGGGGGRGPMPDVLLGRHAWTGCAAVAGSVPRPPFSAPRSAVKPMLHVAQGRIVPLEKVRTTARAAQRLVELAVQAAGDGAGGPRRAPPRRGRAGRGGGGAAARARFRRSRGCWCPRSAP